MAITTLEPNLPRFTLLRNRGGAIEIVTHDRRPILTTDEDALVEYAIMRARMNPSAIYSISRLNLVMEM